MSEKKDLTAIWEEAIRERQRKALLEGPPLDVPLPSGLKVKAVRVNLLSILEAGRIPDGLTPFVTDLMKLGDEGDAGAIDQEIRARWEEWEMTLDAVWVSVVVEPRFTRGASRGEDNLIPVRLVEVEDKVSLFNWCQGVTDHLAAFRETKSGDARPVADESGVPKVHGGGTLDGSEHPSGEPVAGVADESSGDVLGTVRRQPARSQSRKDGGAKAERQAHHSRT